MENYTAAPVHSSGANMSEASGSSSGESSSRGIRKAAVRAREGIMNSSPGGGKKPKLMVEAEVGPRGFELSVKGTSTE